MTIPITRSEKSAWEMKPGASFLATNPGDLSKDMPLAIIVNITRSTDHLHHCCFVYSPKEHEFIQLGFYRFSLVPDGIGYRGHFYKFIGYGPTFQQIRDQFASAAIFGAREMCSLVDRELMLRFTTEMEVKYVN